MLDETSSEAGSQSGIGERLDASFLPASYIAVIERSSCRPEAEKTSITQVPLEDSKGLGIRMRRKEAVPLLSYENRINLLHQRRQFIKSHLGGQTTKFLLTFELEIGPVLYNHSLVNPYQNC